jgi:hypothetical protein
MIGRYVLDVQTRLPLWARAADAAAIALLFLAAYVAIEGGFVLSPADVRLSVRSAWRVLAWAGVLVLLRHVLIRRHPLHRRLIDGIGAAARAPGPLRDDLTLLRRERTPSELRRGSWRRGVIAACPILALYAALTVVMTYPQIRFLSRGVSPDFGDPLLSTWRLAWIAHQLPRDPLHLFDANIFHPERQTLAYSDSMIVPALTVAPFVWLGMHQLLAHNILLLSGFALSGAAMFLFVRSLTQHTGAALVAGFVFAFLPYRFIHYAHLELQMAQWMPLCLWAFHRTLKEGRMRDGLLTGLFLALQTLSSWYYGIFFATYLAAVGSVLAIGAGRERFLAAIRPLVAGAVLAAILVIPFAVPYFQVRRVVGERPVSEIEFYSATPLNYLAAHPRNALLGGVTSKWGSQERELFQGIAVPLIALVGLWPPLSAARIAYAVGLAFAFDLSLGLNGVTYPWLHAYVLPYRGLRVPARMGIVVGLSLAIFVGYGAARIAERLRRRAAASIVLAGMLALIFVEYRSNLELELMWTSPPAVYGALPQRPQTVIVELPLIVPDIALEPAYMYFSTFHWHRLVNGYSGFSPRSYYQLLKLMATFPDEASLAERRRGAEFVIVHGAFYRSIRAYEQVVAKMDERPDLARVGTFAMRRREWPWDHRETRLYRLLDTKAGRAVVTDAGTSRRTPP